MRDESKEVNAKMVEEQQAGTVGRSYYGDTCAALPMRESLRIRLGHTERQHADAEKALRIIEAHPEFEDLLWLLRSGVV